MPKMLNAILEQVSDVFSNELQKKLSITEINPEALTVWVKTWKSISTRQPPDGGWDWECKTSRLNRKYRKRLISIAIWANNELCGLALCRISRGSEVISMCYIEGSPNGQHPLRGYVFQIIEMICLEYAVIKKSKTIRIEEPIDSLMDFYKLQGYLLNKKLLFGRKFLKKDLK
jgi:hypothetical protein